MIFYVQGEYVAQKDARVPVLDRGFLFGDSVYETVRSHGGRIIFWREHLARLRRSAELLEIDIEEQRICPLEVLRELLRLNSLAQSRIRIIVSRGEGGRDQLDGFRATWVVTIEPFEVLPEEKYEEGVAAVQVSIQRHGVASLNPEIKSSNLLNNVLARREAVRAGAAEGILLNPHGYLAEGAYSNLFWVTAQGELRTPALAVGILPGVTRQKVLQVARSLPLAVREVEALPVELDGAREIFLTSTSWEVLSVTRWNGQAVGHGRRGAIARSLREGLRQLYEDPEETA